MSKLNKDIEAIYPLSPTQQGMLFHKIYDENSQEYFEQLSCTFLGEIDLNAFNNAWQTVVDRNPILRTSFIYKKGKKIVQVVHKEIELPIVHEDWTSHSPEEQIIKFDKLFNMERESGINLSKAPLMKLFLIKISDNSYKFLWNHHHIIMDGWSLPLVLNEVFKFYEAYKNDISLDLPLSRPYKDYISWLQKRDEKEAKKFWQEYLKGFTAPTDLVIDDLNVISANKGFVKDKRNVDESTSEKVNELVKSNQITLSSFLQAVWAIILHKYSREKDIVFGATFSGRPTDLSESETIIGLFINTVPIRAKIVPNLPTIEWIKEFYIQQTEVRDFEHTALYDIQKWSDIPSKETLFKSIFVYENYPVDDSLKAANYSIKIKDVQSFEKTNFPLTIISGPGNNIPIEIAYDSALIDEKLIGNLLKHFEEVITQIAELPNKAITNIKLSQNNVASHNENEKLHKNKNNFIGDVVIEFESTVQKYPESTAVKVKNGEISFEELNNRSNYLAEILINKGIGLEDKIGIFLDRSIEMVVSIWAVLKAGAAYVPIDINYPDERINFILGDAGIKVLLSKKKYSEKLITEKLDILYTEEFSKTEKIYENPKFNIDEDNLAYVLYTSGSTGKPKGTLLTRLGLQNYLSWCKAVYPIDEGIGSIVHSTLAFDATITSIFPALISGKTIFLTSEGNDIEELSATLLEYKNFSLVKITPAHMELLSNQIKHDELIGLTKALVIGGENLTSKHIELWQKNSSNTLLFNEYGPTETVVGSVVFEASKWNGRGSVPIGKEIINTKIYILDENLSEVPIGIPGQLYISSIDIARGYLNRPDLTADKFIPNPFLNSEGTRMYATGDLVKMQLDGNLEFIERIDDQVKIRGYRIELSEIEHSLNTHPIIEKSVVLVKDFEDGKKELVAYISSIGNEQLSIIEIREHISKTLPDYMVPTFMIFIDEFPITINGKIDKKVLAKIEISRDGLSNFFVAPRNSTEDLLSTLVKDILKIDKIGMMDDFFELGGHSLSAAQLVARIRDIFSVELPIKSVFESNSIAELSGVIDSIIKDNLTFAAPPLQKRQLSTDLPLSFSQKRLWFLDQLEPLQHNYNIPTSVIFEGELSYTIFEKAIQNIIDRHEVLRSAFTSSQGKPFVKISEHLSFKLEIHDASIVNGDDQKKNIDKIIDNTIKNVFDLAQAPLFKIKLIKIDSSKHIFILVMHHIISDGWSVKIMIDELTRLYNSFVIGEEENLNQLNIQYSDYAVWQNDWLTGETLNNKLEFWKKYLNNIPMNIELPIDFKRPTVQTFNGSTINFEISSGITEKIAELNKREGLTNFMTLLTTFQILLSKYTRQNDIVVGTPIANRSHTDLEKIIGFFVNTVAIRSIIENEFTILQQLNATRKNILDAFTFSDLPFEHIVETIQPERNMSISPIFQVAIVFQNISGEELLLNGIKVSNYEFNINIAKYDLTLYIVENNGLLNFSFEFNTDLFKKSTIERLIIHYKKFLEEVANKPKTKISHIKTITDLEYKEQVVSYNKTKSDIDYERCIHNVFEESVYQYFQKTAVTYSEFDEGTLFTNEVSYNELNISANKLANYLIKRGVGSEKIVAISMSRSIDLIISILAVLKTGAAFLPVDPYYPQERIKFMLDDSDSSFVISKTLFSSTFNNLNGKLIYLDEVNDEVENESSDNLSLKTYSSNLAYVIYTSGTTGKPKGTLLQHEGAVNLAFTQKEKFNITADSKILQFSSLSFDAFVWETVMALLNGASLNLVDQEMINSSELLLNALKSLKISTITIPPSVLGVIDEQSSDDLENLKTVVVAGEKCSAELAKRWKKNRQFVNAYGPTETTVCASMFDCPEQCKMSPPIGKPINNFELYILDKNLNPVPEGVLGELHISGISLARGYHNQPSLTASKFVPNPFSDVIGKRMYKSGDLVRRLESGDIEFIGRIDNQVKLRGFRIELTEIESVLSSYTTINEAIVMVREDNPGNQQLVGYVVMKDEIELNIAEIKSFLRIKLPDYMVPNTYVKLSNLPLTPSKKIDYNLLPKPDLLSSNIESEYIAPKTETEIIISKIGMELLGIERMGIHDNFFELGGHSLLATQFISRIKEALKKDISLKLLFENPSINQLVSKIELIEEDMKDEEIIKQDRGEENFLDLLNEIDGMTDEEAKALLENEDGGLS